MKIKLFLLSLFFISAFTYFSYTVAKEKWTKVDFDTTVLLQDNLPRLVDPLFSYFSLAGSLEVTWGFCLLMFFYWIFKRRWGAFGWMMVIPASALEIFGKLILYHPAPPLLFHRTTLPTQLPSFYVHTDFSYPSGHMTRTIFIATIFFCLVLNSADNFYIKFVKLLLLAAIAFIMGLSRVYLGEHWTTDVVGGALLGIGFGLGGYLLILRQAQD